MKTLVFKFSCSSSPHRLIAQKKTYIYISKKPLGACVHKLDGRLGDWGRKRAPAPGEHRLQED